MYSGGEPQFVEVFRITIPLTEVATATVESGFNLLNNEKINGEINLSETDKKILAVIKYSHPRLANHCHQRFLRSFDAGLFPLHPLFYPP